MAAAIARHQRWHCAGRRRVTIQRCAGAGKCCAATPVASAVNAVSVAAPSCERELPALADGSNSLRSSDLGGWRWK